MKSCTQSATATASQQEPEAEAGSDPSAKPSGLSPPAPAQALVAGAASSMPDKSSSPTYMDKTKDSAGVTVT